MGARRAPAAILALGVAVVACGARTGLDPTSVSPDLVTACTRLLSCGSTAFVVDRAGYTSVSDCLWLNVDTFGGWLPASAGLPGVVLTAPGFSVYSSAACLASASSCSAAAACVTGGFDCATGPANGGCAGDLAVRCDQGQPLGTDCTVALSQPGAHCVLSAQGLPMCGVATCATDTSSCDGNVATACSAGVLTRTSCPAGTACELGGVTGLYGCSGTSGGCIDPHCEGDVRVECFGGSWRIDCPSALAIPGACSPAAAGVGASLRTSPCVPSPQLACNPETHADRCDSTRIVYCDGAERMIDCAAVGFRSCGMSRGRAACQ